MKLAHFDFESIFNILPGEVNVLVLEGETEFFEYCSQLVRQISGGEGGFCLSYDDEILPISKYAAVKSWSLLAAYSVIVTQLLIGLCDSQHCLIDQLS